MDTLSIVVVAIVLQFLIAIVVDMVRSYLSVKVIEVKPYQLNVVSYSYERKS